MLKVHPKFKIYDTTPRKAVKSLIQAGFISNADLAHLALKLHLPVDWDAIIDGVFEAGLIKYHAVTLHTAPVQIEGFPRPTMGGFPTAGFPTMGGFPGVTATAKMDKTIYYDVDDVDYPMTLGGIYDRFNKFHDTFVAVCRKGTGGKLELTGFVYKDNTDLR